jgi:hypothetical protein
MKVFYSKKLAKCLYVMVDRGMQSNAEIISESDLDNYVLARLRMPGGFDRFIADPSKKSQKMKWSLNYEIYYLKELDNLENIAEFRTAWRGDIENDYKGFDKILKDYE